METLSEATFRQRYQQLLQHLKLKGLQPKTIEAYARAICRVGARIYHQINNFTVQQLTDYFTELVASHSWSMVKLDLYGLQFYCGISRFQRVRDFMLYCCFVKYSRDSAGKLYGQ